MCMTELSLDIILFVIGKLDLAGPYSVRSSMILDNCCKVCYSAMLLIYMKHQYIYIFIMFVCVTALTAVHLLVQFM